MMTIFEAAKASTSEILHDYWDNTIPVDCTAIAERMGIEVKTVPMTFINKNRNDDVLSAIYNFNECAQIITDSDLTVVRRNRFVAYEIGHYYQQKIMAHNDDFSFTNWLHPEKHLKKHWWSKPKNRSIQNAFADAFSLWLLIPQNELEDIDKSISRIAFSAHFGLPLDTTMQFLSMLRNMNEIDADAFTK